MPARWAGVALLVTLMVSGCTARQVGRDTDCFRVAVCDLYAEQAIDNLIRAKTNQPFVQLVYRDLLAQTTDMASGMAMGSTELARETGPVAGIMRTVTSGFSASGSASRMCQLSLHADPVVDRPDVYEAFVRFANDPGLFVESDDPPPGPVHIHRTRHKKHYWVPSEAGPTFLALVLLTSFHPPGEPPVSPGYDVEIEEVKIERQPIGEDKFYTVNLKFKDPVPKGDGTLVIDLPGENRQVRLTVQPLPSKDKEAEKGPEGTSINWVFTQFNPARVGLDHPGLLNRQKGQFYSYKFPRLVPPPGPPIAQRIYNEIDRIRAQQRTGSTP